MKLIIHDIEQTNLMTAIIAVYNFRNDTVRDKLATYRSFGKAPEILYIRRTNSKIIVRPIKNISRKGAKCSKPSKSPC